MSAPNGAISPTPSCAPSATTACPRQSLTPPPASSWADCPCSFNGMNPGSQSPSARSSGESGHEPSIAWERTKPRRQMTFGVLLILGPGHGHPHSDPGRGTRHRRGREPTLKSRVYRDEHTAEVVRWHTLRDQDHGPGRPDRPGVHPASAPGDVGRRQGPDRRSLRPSRSWIWPDFDVGCATWP